LFAMADRNFTTRDAHMERYTCSKCSRHFVAAVTAVQISCPNCNFVNILKPDAVVGPGDQPAVPRQVPQYTLEEASGVAKALVAQDPENNPDWTKVNVTYEGVEGCWSKLISLNINNDKVYANKATGLIDASPDIVLSVYWNGRAEVEWNTTTVQKVTLLEDLSSVQLFHHELKKNAMVNMQNDIVFRRAYDRNPDGSIWAYAVSEASGPPVKPGITRGTVVFGGMLAKKEGNKTRVTLIWCFDYNKKLQVKYNDEEPKRTALRLCKIKKMIEDAAAVAVRAAEYEKQKSASYHS